MPVTIHELLADLRSRSLDERDKGEKFERLIKAYLSTDPEWTSKFENVWLWSEWPGRGPRTDTGIDLVAERRDGEGLAAIQCKFYSADHKVSKADIDSFISASAKSEWTERFVFDTAAGWTGNAEETLQGVAQRIDIGFLDDARVDWSQCSWQEPDTVELATAHQPRRHQIEAIDGVRQGFETNDRGKLIMACGTGKTFTSLKLAEEMVGAGGSILFLVPSIQLLSQSLREWTAQSEVDIRPFAVCSDVRVGRNTNNDSGEISTINLTEPATTDPAVLAQRMTAGTTGADERMTVVFSTYQSIDVVSKAQDLGLAEFDLVICDEAHRTTGVTLAGEDESHFVQVHDNRFIQATKRLYMTATPRVFDDAVTKKATENNAMLANMGDESTFGPELHRLGFGEAVEKNLLTDYKVIVLTVDEAYVSEHFQTTLAEDGEIQLNDAAKLLGSWQGLGKNYARGDHDGEGDAPMRRAVAFAKDIRSSRTATRAFPALIERALQDESRVVSNDLRVESRHVDGGMGIHERNKHLEWLKADTDDGICRILTNARCLSEGVDVPALDAVMFLTPRSSQVDVVQSVGRVMRKDPAGVKKQGYIILPVVIPAGVPASEALNDNKRYKTVWQVLQALRSHDDRFNATVNQINFNKKQNEKIDIVDGTPPTEAADGQTRDGDGTESQPSDGQQLTFDFGFESFRDAMYARIVKKVGERKYWENWANDVAEIAQRHITRISGLLEGQGEARARFDEFLHGLRGILNESITEDEAIEMLAQHLITRPVFEALFSGYDFAANNPVSQVMESMLAVLDEHGLSAENATLEKFYESVRRSVDGIDNAEGRQEVLLKLYNNFFSKAFKKTVDKLGIVYTPVEIVDFILRSADEVLQQEFGQSLSDEGVHILDGFTGTGTFVVRLLQLGLVKPHDLARKFAEEIHANEILLLAYYIAAVNIETTYADIVGEPAPFPGLVLTDTFQSYEDGNRQDLDIFPANNERIERQRKLPITVVIGNPPYSSGQDSANDNNANESYPSLDQEIRGTYAARSSAKLKNKLYDPYVRAFKWATLRIEQGAGRGVIAFVTNGGFVERSTFGGMRQTLAEEFSDIYVFNLRGNQRTAGEQSRREGGKVFGQGSRATVAITLLVKNPESKGPATIHYADVEDYLSTKQKLARVSNAGSLLRLGGTPVRASGQGDWTGRRDDKFPTFIEIDSIFNVTTHGVNTGRDAWVYQSSDQKLLSNMNVSASTFNTQVDHWTRNPGPDRSERGMTAYVDRNPERISWSSNLLNAVKRGDKAHIDQKHVRISLYRPFFKQFLYFDPLWNSRPGANYQLFPPNIPNKILYTVGYNSTVPFSALSVDQIPNLHVTGAGSGGSVFARWRYEALEPEDGTLGLFPDDDNAEVVDGYRQIDNITDEALKEFQAVYSGEQVSKDDIFYYVYGLLHSPEYRDNYADDLEKSLPRIPFVADFRGYADAGRALSDLHLGYESVEPYALEGLDAAPPAGSDPYAFYSVGDKKITFGKPTAEQKSAGVKKDCSTIIYSDRITVSGIPEEAHRYMVGSRSAIEWIMDRYYVKTDKKAGIVNDPNDWSREVGDPRYILDLLARVVTVSVETMRIVDSLPALDIIGTEPAED